jgi:hypothetical protein
MPSKSRVGQALSPYLSDEFRKSERRPHCQFNNKSKVNYGLLIDRPNIEAARFRHALALANGWRKISQEFSGSDGPVDCLVAASPVIIVVRRGVTRSYDRATGDLLGLYNRKEHGRLNVIKVSRFLVYLAAQTKDGYTLLHPQPMQLSMKGVQRGAFLEPGGHLDLLDRTVDQFYPGAPKFAFAIHLETAPDMRGTGGSASLVTVLKKPEPISSQEALDDRFIGEENLKVIMQAYQESKEWQAAEQAAGDVVDDDAEDHDDDSDGATVEPVQSATAHIAPPSPSAPKPPAPTAHAGGRAGTVGLAGAIYAKGALLGLGMAQIDEWAQQYWGRTVEALTPDQQRLAIQTLEQSLSAAATQEPLDLARLQAETDVEMARVGWGKKDGRQFLEATFGKSNRAQLTPEEYRLFHQHLKGLPNKMAPSGLPF